MIPTYSKTQSRKNKMLMVVATGKEGKDDSKEKSKEEI